MLTFRLPTHAALLGSAPPTPPCGPAASPSTVPPQQHATAAAVAQEPAPAEAAAASRRAPARERCDAHTARGNALLRSGDAEAAEEAYTAALNAVPCDARALCNRSAARASRDDWGGSLADALAAAAASVAAGQGEYAKAHSRAGCALLRLGRHADAAAAYRKAQAALAGAPDVSKQAADVAAGLAAAVAASEAAAKRASAAAKARPPPRAPPLRAVWSPPAPSGPTASAAAAASGGDAVLAAVRSQRAASAARWRASTKQASPHALPETIVRPGAGGGATSSPQVDLFGRLRGACPATKAPTGRACPGWRRDITSPACFVNGTMLTCEACGGLAGAHDNCGACFASYPGARGVSR